jgi:NADH-quinone oxidoreductase subunit H
VIEILAQAAPLPGKGTGVLELVQRVFSPETYDQWGWLIVPVACLLFILLVVLPVATLVVPLFAIWLERKVSAHMQSRLGPMEIGWHGWLQTLADGVKLLGKEDVIPAGADKGLFILGPIIALAGVFAMLAALPVSPHLIPADLNVAIVYLAAVGSIEVLGVLMAGWASNNKWAVFGTMRLATQLVSYEVPLGVSLLTVVAITGTLSVQETVQAQHGWLWNWLVFRNPVMPLVFLTYFTASLAENKRAPFDLPEAESELVAGFHTEYSGMRFSIFFLAEYVAMYVVSVIAACLFLGGWNSGIGPLDHFLQGARGGWGGEEPALGVAVAANLVGFGVLFAKAWVLIFVQMWLRWTLPRIRLDQVMDFCLKFLLPASVFFFVVTCGWEVIPWRSICAQVPVLQDRLPRAIIFGVCAGLVGWWAWWFTMKFQVPFKANVQEKPWVLGPQVATSQAESR